MARSISFIIEGVVDTRITVTETADGGLLFEVEALGGAVVGDLRAMFFDLSGLSADGDLSITGGDVTAQAFGQGSVSSVGGDANVNGAVVQQFGRFDAGVAFGTPGAGRDDIRSTSFTLSHETERLTLDMLSGADFGLRYTSVGPERGNRSGGAKIGGSAPVIGGSDELEVVENGTATLNLLANDGLAAGATITGFTLNGVAYAAGDSAKLIDDGRQIGLLTVLADGTATLAATGPDADALSADETARFDLTYTAKAGSVSAVGFATATIKGENDAPSISPPTVTTGLVPFFEDFSGSRSGQFTISDPDAGTMLTLSIGNRSLPFGGAGGSLVQDGVYGVLTLNADGSWRYDYDSTRTASQALAAGTFGTDVFTITVTDEFGASDVSTIQMSVLGANDAPEIQLSSIVAGTVSPDGTPTATGQLEALDIDGDALTWSGSAAGKYGRFEIDATSGEWTYTLDPRAYEALFIPPGTSRTETFSVTVSDGRSADTEEVAVTIVRFLPSFFFVTATGPETFGDAEVISIGATQFGTPSISTLPLSNTIVGRDIEDIIYGDAKIISIDERYSLPFNFTMGSDVINGSGGDDIIYGDIGTVRRDPSLANASGTFITIVGGNDIIIGGPGNDLMFGDFGARPAISGIAYQNGADIFVFEPGSGLDIIGDFDLSDRLDVAAYGFTNFAEIQPFITTGALGTVIDLDRSAEQIDEVLLIGFVGPLTEANFLFA